MSYVYFTLSTSNYVFLCLHISLSVCLNYKIGLEGI